MIRKIHNHPRIVTNWGNHKSDTMAKVQHFSGISKRIPFEGFDFYDLFRVTFENSELGRMKRLLPGGQSRSDVHEDVHQAECPETHEESQGH